MTKGLKLNDLVEKAAEQCVMLDHKDLQGLAFFSKLLKELASSFVPAECGGQWQADKLKEAAGVVAKMVERIIFEESKDPVKDLELVGRTVMAFQTVCRGSDVRRAGLPVELGIDLNGGPEESGKQVNSDQLSVSSDQPARRSGQSSVKSDKPVAAKPAFVLPPGVDDVIFQAFIEQQISVFPDIEEKILAFEKSAGSPDGRQHLAALKRLLHTMKGESGVVGINDMQSFCHKLEDYLEDNGHKISADILFEAKDWLEKAVKAYANGALPESADELLARLLGKTGSGDATVKETDKQKSDATDKSKTVVQNKPVASSAPVVDLSHLLKSIQIGDADLAADFVKEANEHFEIADENLLILENEPTNQDAIGAVFRSFHTIKGVSGFLGLPPIGSLAHKAETLLDDVRRGKRQFAGSVVDVTFASLDLLKNLVSDLGVALQAKKPFMARQEILNVLGDLTKVLAGEAIEKKAETGGQKSEVSSQERSTGSGEDKTSVPAGTATNGEAVPAGEKAAGQQAGAMIGQTVKIDAERLDLLIDTIGEMVIAESIVAQDAEILSLRSQRIEKNIGHLGKITRMLQDMSMAMRMVPIDATFRKMVRLVRDLAKKADKRVEISLVGNETELDRGMVDKLGDPLIHMIRNSVDHGIEATEGDRVKAGKDPLGHIILKAFHKGGNIHIEITDDGKGLDRKAIAAKGIERGLITVAQADKMPDQEIFAMIFQAGFSTAKVVTEISGRGVGMDVVRRNIENMRGSILIDSTYGKGATFTLVLPLTMAIIDGMIVCVGGETYIIPTLSIIESLRPVPQMISTVTGRGEVMQFREKLLPLFRLSKLFHVAGAIASPCDGIVVVIEDGGRQTALLVDDILGQQQTVIKSLSDAMGAVAGVSGASIMADGKPGLIIDVAGLVKLATSEKNMA